MEVGDEELGIAIVGGGICGLATALALHRFHLSLPPRSLVHYKFMLHVNGLFLYVVISEFYRSLYISIVIYMNTYRYMYICMYVCMYLCMFVYMHTYILSPSF